MHRRRLMRRMIIMGSAPYWSVQLNGATSKIDCGSDAGLDNLGDAAFTAEAWARHGAGQNTIIAKSNSLTGWELRDDGANLCGFVYCATAAALSIDNTTYGDGLWHHFAMTFDDAGDRKVDLFVDGVESGYAAQIAGVDAIVADAVQTLTIGVRGDGGFYLTGAVGWARISNVVRYVGAFTPSRIPPALDANTLAQWNLSEGAGVAADNAEGTAGRDGVITDGTWIKWF